MRRRKFLRVLGGAAVSAPYAAFAQSERVRSIGVLLPTSANNSEYQARLGAFMQGLQQAGWSIGQNVRIVSRLATSAADIRKQAAELAALAPDVILAAGASTVGPLLQATRTVPIVFATAAVP